MSDPKATKMTLEEAVEIIEQGDPMGWFERPPNWQERRFRWTRARAIVHAAVEFVNAGEGRDADNKLLMLRALERGESEVQP